jgi:hypothetical protein
MIKILLRDPFWVSPSEVASLTDRQMWELYILPALERQMRESDHTPMGPGSSVTSVLREDDPSGTIRDEFGREISPEAFLRTLAAQGVVSAAEVEETIRKAKEADAGGG